MAEVEVVASNSVEVRFEARRCVHSRNCVLGRPDVFVPNVEGEWLHPERATAEEVAELAHNCPSGAIQYRRLDGGAQESAPKVNTVRIRENGPLSFHAALTVTAAVPAPAFRATLCRCGASQSKPYCDGSHHAAGFIASGEAPVGQMQALPARDGPLEIVPAKNGPLLVKGSLEVVTGTGATIAKCASTALCRCGHSANKPYCDGSHAKAGFQAD
jgi:CDGSH-type Zn-finger protein/uncharacterized Fe-S cluster protein YjdI